MQPWVDAAFKKRGIDPENFWRSAGLPAFRFPDPNGTRFPNGAPPPAPPVLEGTPDHPGPAVAPGSPCSYTPANPGGNVTVGDGLPRPWNPLPCAGAMQVRSVRTGPFPAPLDVHDVAAQPRRSAADAGHPDRRAGRASRRPTCPGTPVPLPAHAPPGARTETWRRPDRRRRRRRSRRACRRGRRRRRDPGRSCRRRSSTRAERAVAAQREVARIEHHL